MDLVAAVSLALALIAPAAQSQADSRPWTERVAAAQSSESALERLIAELRPLIGEDAPSREVVCAYAKATVSLALSRLEGTSAIVEIEKAVVDARLGDPDCLNADTPAALEWKWAGKLIGAGQLSRARDVLEKALASNPDARIMQPLLETRLAAVLVQRGQYDAVLAALARAEAGLQPKNALHAQARGDIEGVRGDAWLALGAPDLAFGCFETCAQLAESEARASGEFRTLVEARLRQAGLAIGTQDFARVALLLDATLEQRARELGGGYYAQVLVRRGLAASDLERDEGGQAGTARDMLAAALAEPQIHEIEALAAELALAELALRNRDLDAARARIDDCLRRVERWREGGDLEPPLREIALLEAHRGSLALLGGEPAGVLTERAAGLRAAIDELLRAGYAAPLLRGGIGLLHWDTRRHMIAVLVELELAIDGGERGRSRGLEAIAAVQAAGTLARSVGAGAVTVADVRRDMLAPLTGALVYLPSRERSYVFALDRDSITCAVLPRRDLLVREVGFLEELVSVPPGSNAPRRRADIARHAATLAGWLFPAPVQAKIEAWSSVIIVGADLLNNLPFECLPLADGQPLGIARAVSRMPSLPVGVWLARRRNGVNAAPALDIVLVAAPEALASALALTSDARPLVLDPANLKRLLAPFARARTAVLTGPDARASELIETSAAGVQLLTLLTHGIYDTARSRDGERPAGLVLTPESGGDGVLWCADVERIRAPRLVELLACGATRGPSRLGDDTGAHLGGAFFAAGAETVVASRCDIPEAATIDLSVILHDRLCGFADTPAEAMRQARAIVAADPATNDPYYWALLSVEGLADRALFARDPASRPEARSLGALWGAASALVVLLVLLVVLARQRRIARAQGGRG